MIPFDPVHQNRRSLWDRSVERSKKPDSGGSFYFVHSLLPHQPYEFDGEGNMIREVSAVSGFENFDEVATAYVDQVMFVDTCSGCLLTS